MTEKHLIGYKRVHLWSISLGYLPSVFSIGKCYHVLVKNWVFSGLCGLVIASIMHVFRHLELFGVFPSLMDARIYLVFERGLY